MSLFSEMMDEESKLHRENAELKRQIEQAMKDWSADAIKKTEVIVGLERKLEKAVDALELVRSFGYMTQWKYIDEALKQLESKG